MHILADATVYAVMETAKANGLNLEKYISYLLTALPEHFAKDSKAAVDDLLPWPDGVMELCQRSVGYLAVTDFLPLPFDSRKASNHSV